MTKQDKWQQIEKALTGGWGSIKFNADGHVVGIHRHIEGDRIYNAVFVDGSIKGIWHNADGEKPAHAEARFWRPMYSRGCPLKQRARLVRLFGKARAEKMTARKVTGYSPFWPTRGPLIRHLKRHFPDLAIIDRNECVS